MEIRLMPIRYGRNQCHSYEWVRLGLALAEILGSEFRLAYRPAPTKLHLVSPWETRRCNNSNPSKIRGAFDVMMPVHTVKLPF
jgi:hypothetical protein